jgi:uncharacterized membrane protein YphA (DoxX/SURF4 family)
VGLRLLAVMLGVFLVVAGIDKLPWLADSTLLSRRVDGWLDEATPAARWYIDTIVRPGVPLFARLVPLAELAAGAALIAGFWIRLAAALALLVAINFHIASGSLAEGSFLRDGLGLPVLGGLLALAIGGWRLPFSVSRQ